jgi:hypothetical protein
MIHTKQPSTAKHLSCGPKLFSFSAGLAAMMLLIGMASPLWAQSKIYTWTDEQGVTHFSDSMVSPETMKKAAALESTGRAMSNSETPTEDIPLVTFPDRPSQKFVQAELEGGLRSKRVLMLVDTGAQITFLDQSLAEELDVEHVQDAQIWGVTGGAKGWIGRLSTLRLGSEEVRDLQVMVGSRPGLVLLGMDVLDRLQLAVGQRSLHPSK